MYKRQASDNALTLLDGKIKVDEFNSQISYNDGLIKTKGNGLIGKELFQISLNPKEWINEQKTGARVKLSHLETETDAYINRDVNDQWNSIISSEDLYAKISVSTDDKGKLLVSINDLNVSSAESIENLKLSPEPIPSLRLSAKNSMVNEKELSLIHI